MSIISTILDDVKNVNGRNRSILNYNMEVAVALLFATHYSLLNKCKLTKIEMPSKNQAFYDFVIYSEENKPVYVQYKSSHVDPVKVASLNNACKSIKTEFNELTLLSIHPYNTVTLNPYKNTNDMDRIYYQCIDYIELGMDGIYPQINALLDEYLALVLKASKCDVYFEKLFLNVFILKLNKISGF